MKRQKHSNTGLRRSVALLAATVALLGAQGQAQTSGTLGGTTSGTYCTAVYSVGPYSSSYGQIQVYSPDRRSLITVDTGTATSPNAAAVNGKNGWLYYASQSSLQVYVYNADTDRNTNTGYALRNEGGSLIGGSFDATSQYYYVYFSSGKIAQYSVSGTSLSYVGSRYVKNSSGYDAFRDGTNGDIVISPGGQAYIIGEDGSGYSMVGSINLSTGVVSNLKYLTSGGYKVSAMNGLAYDPTGSGYYVSDKDTLFKMDVGSGAMSVVNSQNSSYDLASCGGGSTVPPIAPSIAKSFNPNSATLTNGSASTRLTITLGNNNASPIYLTKDLLDALPTSPSVMSIAGTPNLSSTCPSYASYVVASAGSNQLTVKSGQRVPVGGCTVSVDVNVKAAGTYTNNIAAGAFATSAGSNASATSATFTVTGGGPSTPPVSGTCTVSSPYTQSFNTAGALAEVRNHAYRTDPNVVTSTDGTYTLWNGIDRTGNGGYALYMNIANFEGKNGGTLGTPGLLYESTINVPSGSTVNYQNYVRSHSNSNTQLRYIFTDTATGAVLKQYDGAVATTSYTLQSVPGFTAPDDQVTLRIYTLKDGTSADLNVLKLDDLKLTCTTPVTPQLTVGKSGNGPWSANQAGANYTITLTNASSVPTSGTITVKDLLPAGVTPGSLALPSGWASSVSGQTVTLTTSNVLAAGASVNLTLPVNVSNAAASSITNKVAVGGGGDPDALPDPALCTPGSSNPQNQCAAYTTTVSAPPVTSCTNLYAMVITETQYSNGVPVLYNGGKIQRLDELTNTLTGTAINLPNGATSATLAVAPDGSRFFTADDNDSLWIYSTSTASWTRGSSFSGVSDRLVRMTMTPGGIGYAMDSSGNFWSFNQSGSTQYLGKLRSTSTTTPNFYQNGDFFATADGKLYMMSAQTGGTVNLWFVNPAALTAEYLGNLTDAANSVQYNGLAATPNGVFAANSAGRLGRVDPINVTITPVGGTTTGSTDLASCYFPTYAPKVDGVKSVKKVAGSTGTDVRPGDTLEYSIVVRNSGTLPAGGVTFKDALPAGTTYVPDSARVNGFTTTTLNGSTVNLGGATYPFTNSVGICSQSTTACTNQVLKVDSTPSTVDNESVITFRVTVNEGVTSVRNIGVINYNDGNTPPKDIPTNPVETPVVPWPQLSIVKTSNATNGTWTVGQSGAEYTLTVRNTSTQPTSGTITVKDLLPAGLTYGTVSAPTGWTCTVSGQLLTCTTTTVLQPDETVELTVPVNVTGSVLGTLTNKAVVGGGTDPNPIPDPATCTPGSTNPQDQCASVPVNVVGTPTLNVTKTVQKVAGSTGTAVYPGDTLEYTIVVRNSGNIEATGVTFQDLLPAGVTYVPDTARVNGFNTTVTNGTATTLAGSTYPLGTPIGICSQGAAACTTQTVKVDTTPTTLDNEAVITFRVKVVDPFTLNPSQVSNQAVVKYPGGPDTPSDDPTTPTPGDPTVTPVIKPAKLNVVKTVQNITAGTAPGTSGSGKPGDILEYCIATTNVGSANATKISFGDTVPANTTFQVNGYGAGKDIHVTTSTGADLYYTAAQDSDAGALLSNRVTISEPTFVLQPQQSFKVCFRTTIK